KCITHEIDVIGKKGDNTFMVEAKFHNSVGIKTDVHVALYTQARFEDVREKNGFNKAFLITNTKATTDAITYAHCVGMEIMTWDYPEGNSLRDLVEKYGLYPITALSTLPQSTAQALLEKSNVLSLDICKNPALLDTTGLSEEKKKQILEEAKLVCEKTL